jgi:ParB/RepB/Spo0J family partition protein
MTKTKDLVEDSVLYIPRNTIHPDPDQPRVKVDDELQASIDSEGIIQAITVRPHPTIEDEWMIVDGERRYLGGAHLKTIPCRIRLDLEEPVDRLITQLAANSGKPLTPIEQARAFKKALDADPKLSQAKLAERLGVPRSTIGDRIRLIEIHSAWMKLIESGRLQVSHAPLIHQYRAVPDEYQVKAAQNISEAKGWQIQKYDKGDVIPIGAFRDILREAFKDYVIRLDDVRSYKGPVLEIEEEIWSYGPGAKKLKKVKYAADITLWRPIKREAEKRAKKARTSSPSSYGSYESPMAKVLKSLKSAGIDVPVRKSSGQMDAPLKDGETVIFDNGWPAGIHPQTLLDRLDRSTLIRVQGSYGEGRLATTDAAAVAAAREVYAETVAAVAKKVLAPLKEKLSDKVLAAYAIHGPGTKGLIGFLDFARGRGDETTIAMAIGVNLDTGELSQADGEKLLAALAACSALAVKIPNSWTVDEKVRQAVGSPAFKLPAPPYISKTRAKKMARKDKEVPIAAAVDVGAVRAAVEADVAEGELEEAAV